MNRDIALEASLAVAVGLLIVVWAGFRSSNAPRPGAMRRGGIAAVLTYGVLAVPVFATSGLTLVGLAVLLVVMALAFTASRLSLSRSRGGDRSGPESGAERYAGAAVAVGITAVLLISAGQTLSLLSRLDPRVIVVAIALVAALLAGAQGVAGTHRIGSTALWFVCVLVVAALAIGFYLGTPDVVIDPIRLVDGVSVGAAIAIGLVLLAIGWADTTMRASALAGRWSPARTLGGALVIVALIVLGLLMLLGGGILVPSMEFFTIPANIDMIPGAAGVVLVILTVVFTALVALAVAGPARVVTPPIPDAVDDDPAPGWVVAVATLAGLLALVDVGAPLLLLLTGLVAAALMGSQLFDDRGGWGLVAGLVAAVIAAVVLLATGQTELGWPTSLALVATGAVAAVAAAGSRLRSTTETELDHRIGLDR